LEEAALGPIVFWSCLAGSFFLLLGLFAVTKEFSAAIGLDKFILLGRVFVAASLAAFGAEHLAGAQLIKQVVPSWMPAPLFWTYFVGLALFAAALSLISMKYIRWSALSLAAMFFLFVVMIHVPGVAAHPRDRIFWTVMLRDLAFGAGALALAGAQTQQGRLQSSNMLIFIARLCIAIPVIFFGVELLLHPTSAPGVPLAKLTPAWVPIPLFWAYLTGAVLLVAGAGMLVNKRSRMAATSVGIAMTLLTVLLYLPILLMASRSLQLEGLNYVADTLLFGGTALLLAAAMPETLRHINPN
jgi:uncharacterized membrane protein